MTWNQLIFTTADEIDKILILLFDTLIFMFTIHKTWYQVQQASLARMSVSYSQLLLRDGEFPLYAASRFLPQ